MPRRKIAMRLIENARDRARTYAKRTTGLQKMASELAVLCAVPVALVCAPAAGTGAPAPLVWESEEGVIDRYRAAAAVPSEARALHTHRSYLEAELGKEKAKLARVRPAALPDWDPALNDMTQDEAREVLRTIDAALCAAKDRMAALGLPADGRLELQQQQTALAPDDGSSADSGSSGLLAPQLLGPGDVVGTAGFQTQLMPYPYNDDGSNDHIRLLELEQFLMQPEYGLECGGGGGSYDVDAVSETQAPGGYGDNADCMWPDLAMSYAADGSWDAVVPVGYYDPNFADGALVAPEQYSSAQNFALVAPEQYSAQNYVDTAPLEYTMGMQENLAYPNMDNSYMAHWQAEGFQRSDNSTGQYQYQWSDPEACSSNQAFHYQYQY